MLRPATGDRENFAIGGGVVEGQDLGSREGFANIKSQSEQFRNFLRGLDKKILKDSNLADLIEQSKIDISKTTASNVLAENEFLKIRPKRTLNVEDKNKIKKLLEGKTGRVESITYKGTDYYKASDGRIREKINLKADRPEAYKIKQAKEIEKLNLIKSKDVFPNPGKDIKFQIWKDLYESTKQRTYGPRAGGYEPPEPRLKVVTRPNDLTTAAVKNKLVLLDTRTNKKVTFKNLKKYIDSLPDTSFKEMSLPYKYKNWLSDQTINYKGKTNVSLRTVLRENLLTKNQLNNWKASPYQVHHPFGINENPFKVQLAMHKPNGLEGHIRLDTLKQLDKAGTNEKDVKKILNNFEKKIKNVGGIQSGVRDVLVGESLTPDRFLKNLFSEAKIGRETRPLLKKAIPDLIESGQLTTADKAPIPKKTNTREMFEQANKRLSDGPTLGMNLGLGKALGSALKTVPTPAGALAITTGFGFDPTSAIDRAGLGLEAAFAPELVKQSAKMGAAQRFFNLGLSPKLAARAARVASPLGIASLGLEGLYQYGKFAKDEIAKVRAMDDEERLAYNEGLMDEGGLLD
jgi:hypothetical protein